MSYYDVYQEQAGLNLLDGSAGATAVSRINGAVPASWPGVVDFGNHRLEIARDGNVRLIHNGPLSENPNLDQQIEAGRFTYSLTDGSSETGEITASVTLYGVGVEPLGLALRPAAGLAAGAEPGTSLATLEARATAPVGMDLVSSSLAAQIVGNELVAAEPVPAGTHDFVVRVANAYGDPLDVSHTLDVPEGAIHRGQHDPADSVFAGPTGSESTFLSPRGNVLHPTGTGVWRYVDASVSASGDGLSPANAYKTIQEAFDAARAGDSILVEPGVYGEAPQIITAHATATDRIKLCRRGTGSVEVTTTEPLGAGVGDWADCVNGDADGNPNWASLKKITVTKANWRPLQTAALRQSGQPAFLHVTGFGTSYDTTVKMWAREDNLGFLTSGNSAISDGSEDGSRNVALTGALFGTYPSGSLGDALVVGFLSGSFSEEVPVISHDPVGESLSFGPFTSTRTYQDGIILLNVARSLSAPGQWAFKDNGDGTATIFFWPYDAAKMDEVRLSTRIHGIDIDEGAHWTFYGIDVTGANGGKDSPQGAWYGARSWHSSKPSQSDQPGVVIEECSAKHVVSEDRNSMGFGFGAGMPGIRILNCTVSEGSGCAGVAFDTSPGAWVDSNLIENIAWSGVRHLGHRESAITRNKISNIRGTHGNGVTLYAGSRNLVVWANLIDMGLSSGMIPMAFQWSSDYFIGMNVIVANPNDINKRSIDNNGSQPPSDSPHTDPTTLFNPPPLDPPRIVVIQNTGAPWRAGPETTTGGMFLHKTTWTRHYTSGNATFGLVNQHPTSVVWAADGQTYDTTLSRFENNVIWTSLTAASADLTDTANGDYRPKSAGALDTVGPDNSDLLPTGEQWFLDLGLGDMLSRDFNGTLFDWATGAPMGAILPE